MLLILTLRSQVSSKPECILQKKGYDAHTFLDWWVGSQFQEDGASAISYLVLPGDELGRNNL